MCYLRDAVLCVSCWFVLSHTHTHTPIRVAREQCGTVGENLMIIRYSSSPRSWTSTHFSVTTSSSSRVLGFSGSRIVRITSVKVHANNVTPLPTYHTVTIVHHGRIIMYLIYHDTVYFDIHSDSVRLPYVYTMLITWYFKKYPGTTVISLI